jgi:hypothetical protein
MEETEKLVDKISEKILNFSKSKIVIPQYIHTQNGGVISAGIFSGIDLIKKISHRGTSKFLIFAANKAAPAIGYSQEIDNLKLYSSQEEIKLFLPRNNFFTELSKILLETRTVANIFTVGFNKEQLHIPTFFELCNNSGGCGFYYNISENVDNYQNDMKYKYEKLHYDLNRLLTRKEYTDVKISFKSCSEIEINEVFGNFGKRSSGLNNLFFSSISSDFNLSYNLKIKKTLKEGKSYSFQCSVIYYDQTDHTMNTKIINYSILATEDLSKVYSFLDNDCMVKLLLIKELSDCLTLSNKRINCFDSFKDNLTKKLIDCFYFYKVHLAQHTRPEHFTIPSACRYIPLFLNSVYKKYLMRKIKNKFHPNLISSIINNAFSLPLNNLMKMLYPRLYRLDDINIENKDEENGRKNTLTNIGLNHQTLPIIVKPYIYPLSLDSLDLHMSFLMDDGNFLNIIILSEINNLFIYENFGFDHFQELHKYFNNPNFNLGSYFDGRNDNDYNVRITNTITQLREENCGNYQALKVTLIE